MPLHRKPTSTFIVLSIICFFGCDPLEIFLHRGLSMWIKFSQLRLSWIFLLVCRFPCLHPSFCFWAIPYFSIGCPLAMFSISFCSTRKGLLLSRLWLLTTEMELGTILGTGPQGFGDVGFRLSQGGELLRHMYASVSMDEPTRNNLHLFWASSRSSWLPQLRSLFLGLSWPHLALLSNSCPYWGAQPTCHCLLYLFVTVSCVCLVASQFLAYPPVNNNFSITALDLNKRKMMIKWRSDPSGNSVGSCCRAILFTRHSELQ